MGMVIEVQPIYGDGWSGVPGAPGEPAQFHMTVSQRVRSSGQAPNLFGQVREQSHPLNGHYAYLAGRHLPFDKQYSAAFFAEQPALLGPDLEWRRELDALVIASGFVIVGTINA
jgi:hypothetical protein